MGEVIINKSYGEFKQEMDQEIQKTAEGFVRIGYLLKLARDTNVLAESGYATVTEFAQKEYGLDKTQVSRFISINDRFSEGGCSDHLLPEYQGFGYAKLTIMLQIPEEITQELTPAYTKAEIQAVKEELDEEKKVTDIEVCMEAMEHPQKDESLMKRTLKELGKSDFELWEKLWKEKKKDGWLDQSAMERIMAPWGDKNYSVRIMSMGCRVMLAMKDGEDRVSITSTRTMEKEIYTKADIRGIWSEILIDAESAEEAYRKTFSEPWPKVEVAPVQQEKKPEPKKESRVTKAKTPEKPKKPSTEQTPAAVVEEPQLLGQMSVQDFPEMMPPEEGKDDGKHDQSGVPDRTGDEAPVGRSEDLEGIARGEVSGADEGAGAPEGGGCEADHEKLVNEVWWKWMDLRENMPANKKFAKGKIKNLYDMTINLAAAMEKLMNAGEADEK